MEVADDDFVVEAGQEPALEGEQVPAADPEDPAVVLGQAFDGLIHEDLVGHHGRDAQQPADLVRFRLELALHEELEEQAEGQVREEGRGRVEDLPDEALAQPQLRQLQVLQRHAALLRGEQLAVNLLSRLVLIFVGHYNGNLLEVRALIAFVVRTVLSSLVGRSCMAISLERTWFVAIYFFCPFNLLEHKFALNTRVLWQADNGSV